MSTPSPPDALVPGLPGADDGGRSRLGVVILLLVGVLVAYGLPFLGIWASVVVPIVVHQGRGRLWGAAAPGGRLFAVLVWVGLWGPALSYFFTGWYWAVTGRDLSTAWLLLPLCGPDGIAGLVVPTVVATLVFAAGLLASVGARRPWLLMAGAWLAPWAHELSMVALGLEMIC